MNCKTRSYRSNEIKINTSGQSIYAQVKDLTLRNVPCCKHLNNCETRKFKVILLIQNKKKRKANDRIQMVNEEYCLRILDPKLNQKQ